ncbi:uncharacterized protein LOC5571739 isoform X2 [Aedes aegypti]|uniref:Uncharacterized protein n=1 Tax=Aedes aegypti TaxID=7159 RepID=A0A1S4FLY9_AEDAE|nr:uncharacterized protein LOC5571739 isoform X2 [Aedes aegypti]
MNLNFMLTEISLQLLGNKFYDTNGRETDNMRDLFTTQNPTVPCNNGHQRRGPKTKGNLMQMMGVPGLDGVIKNSNDYIERQYQGFVDNQVARMESLPECEESVTLNPAHIQADLCEVRIKTRQEFVRMMTHSKKMKDIYMDTLPLGADRDRESLKYNEEERNLLIGEYNRLLYFLKHILADVESRAEYEQIMEVIKGAKETLKLI